MINVRYNVLSKDTFSISAFNDPKTYQYKLHITNFDTKDLLKYGKVFSSNISSLRENHMDESVWNYAAEHFEAALEVLFHEFLGDDRDRILKNEKFEVLISEDSIDIIFDTSNMSYEKILEIKDHIMKNGNYTVECSKLNR